VVSVKATQKFLKLLCKCVIVLGVVAQVHTLCFCKLPH